MDRTLFLFQEEKDGGSASWNAAQKLINSHTAYGIIQSYCCQTNGEHQACSTLGFISPVSWHSSWKETLAVCQVLLQFQNNNKKEILSNHQGHPGLLNATDSKAAQTKCCTVYSAILHTHTIFSRQHFPTSSYFLICPSGFHQVSGSPYLHIHVMTSTLQPIPHLLLYCTPFTRDKHKN